MGLFESCDCTGDCRVAAFWGSETAFFSKASYFVFLV